MASPPPPSFFSLMLDPSATTLKISTEFVTKHLKNKIPKGPITICANGGHSWRIKIKKVGENYYFDSGWTDVVKDVHFMFGDFVLFRLVDKYIFKMFVYGKNSCERSLPKKVKVEDDGSSSVDNVAANADVVNDDDVDDDDNEGDAVDGDDSEDDDVEDEDDDDDDEDDDDDDLDDDDGYEGKEEEEENDDDDDDDVDIDGDDGDPFFVSTISKDSRANLRLPDEFVEYAGIEDEESIVLKNLDGEEWRMDLRPEKVNQSEKLYISSGWADFQQSNDLREGDECVLKFITSEGKILLAKVTEKKRPARQSRASGESSKTKVVKRKRGRELHAHGRDVDVESEDEYMEMVEKLSSNDDDDKDEDSDEDEGSDEDGEGDNDDVDGNEGKEDYEEEVGVDINGNPFFKLTIFNSNKRMLRLPEEFVGLPGIKAYGTIMLKNLKGEEWRINVLLDKSYKSERYLLSAGWVGFLRSNDISVGDECILKFIRKESKLCLAKVTKKQRPAWQPQPSGEILAREDVKRKRGRPRCEYGGDVDVESEDDCVELVKRPCGEDNNNDDNEDKDNNIDDDDNHNDNDGGDEVGGDGGGDNDGDVDVKNEDERVEVVKRPCGEDHDEDDKNGGQDNGVDNGKDNDNDGEDDKNGDVGDPTFSTIISKSRELRLPEALAGLPGINAGGTIVLKNLTGEEYSMGVRLNKKFQKSKRYLLSAGWPGFLRSNGILVGDECVIKFIRNEGKLCLTKVTKKNSPTRQAQPSGKIAVTEVVKRKRGQPPPKDLGDMDVENEDECVEAVKRPCVEGDGKEDDEDDDLEDDDDNNDNDGQDDIDVGGGNINGDVGDPSFATFLSKRFYLALPAEFVGLPGINAGESITMKNLKGEEWSVGVRLNTAYQKTVRYVLTAGYREFLRGNNISNGDECVFKFIRNEGKLCLAKVKSKRQLRSARKSADRILETGVVRRKRGPSSPIHDGGASKSLGRKRGQPQPPVVNRKRGRPSREHHAGANVESKCEDVKKRPRGRPCGQPRQ